MRAIAAAISGGPFCARQTFHATALAQVGGSTIAGFQPSERHRFSLWDGSDEE
jgi:hypothetical protein